VSTDSPGPADRTTGSSGTAADRQAELAAAKLLLSRMGLTAADLLAVTEDKPAMPTFAEYIAQVSATVGQGTRRAYGSYWNRILDHWAERRLDEVTASDIRQLVEYTKTPQG
jgi:integrase/recombinase XerC